MWDSNLDSDLREMMKNEALFNRLMVDNSGEREKYIGFGLTAVVFSSIFTVFCIAGFVTVLFFLISGSYSTLGGLGLAAMGVMFGLTFGLLTLRNIPYVVWQRKLNKRKIGVAALVLSILQAVFATAFVVSGVLIFLSTVSSCSA